MYKWWAKNWWGVAIVIIVHEIVNLDNRKTFQVAKTWTLNTCIILLTMYLNVQSPKCFRIALSMHHSYIHISCWCFFQGKDDLWPFSDVVAARRVEEFKSRSCNMQRRCKWSCCKGWIVESLKEISQITIWCAYLSSRLLHIADLLQKNISNIFI